MSSAICASPRFKSVAAWRGVSSSCLNRVLPEQDCVSDGFRLASTGLAFRVSDLGARNRACLGTNAESELR